MTDEDRSGWTAAKRPDTWRHKNGGAVWLHEGYWRWHLEEAQPYLGQCSTRDEAMDNVERVTAGRRCSFCDKTAHEVAKLIARAGGPTICNECVMVSLQQMAADGWVPPTLSLNVTVDGRMVMTGAMRDRVDAWLMGDDTGSSSKTIWHVMTGFPVEGRHFLGSVPLDPGDFGRCHRLLEAFPEWKAEWRERVVAQFPIWEKLVANWDELAALYVEELQRPDLLRPRLYERMKELER